MDLKVFYQIITNLPPSAQDNLFEYAAFLCQKYGVELTENTTISEPEQIFLNQRLQHHQENGNQSKTLEEFKLSLGH